jgi:hypothetical protein
LNRCEFFSEVEHFVIFIPCGECLANDGIDGQPWRADNEESDF